MKRVNVIVREKLVVRYWELIPMEPGAELLAPQDTATVRISEERRAGKKKRDHWLSETNWPRLKEALVNSRYTSLRGKCGEACLELGLDKVPKKKLFTVLLRIVRKPITYENVFPEKNISLLSNLQINYVEDIIIERDTANLGMSRKEVINVISELGQAKLFFQADNHLYYLIWEKRLTRLKRLERVVLYQATTTEQ